MNRTFRGRCRFRIAIGSGVGTRLFGLAMDATGHAWVASQSNTGGTESFGVPKIVPSTCTLVQEEQTTEHLLLDFEYLPQAE